MENLPEVLLTRPQTLPAVTVPIEPGHVYALDFPVETLQFEVQAHNLQLLFDNGSILVLQGFFSAAEEENLFLRLEDGTLLQGRDVAHIFLMDLQKFVCDSSGDFPMDEDPLSPLLDALPFGLAPAASVEPPAFAAPGAALSPPLPDFSLPTAPEDAFPTEQYLLYLFS
jgi:hypothetical protein